MSAVEPQALPDVLIWVVRDPVGALAARWNYKAAVLSAVVRGTLFFGVNAAAGIDAGLAAMRTEFVFRLATSGFYGALTQAFRRVEPRSHAFVAAGVIVPAVSHLLELAVHWWSGTAELAASVAASMALTTVSTAFNLFAMRNGVLVVGEGRGSLVDDVKALPRLVARFVTAPLRGGVRGLR